jgi:hypothetical protein
MSCRRIAIILGGLALAVLWFLPAAPVRAEDHLLEVNAIDLADCDPIQLQAQVMEINPQKKTLIVAEREVRMMDVADGGQRIKTAFLNIDGKPEPPGVFRVGQYLRIEGFSHPDGYVAASVIQQMAKPPQEKISDKRQKLKKAKAKNEKKKVRRKHRRPQGLPAAPAG